MASPREKEGEPSFFAMGAEATWGLNAYPNLDAHPAGGGGDRNRFAAAAAV